MEERGVRLLEIIRQGLFLQTKQLSTQALGDRSQYIGMSDIAAYLNCQRAAALTKVSAPDHSPNLSSLLTRARGHWFESGIADALRELGLSHVRQLEIFVWHDKTPIKAHLDFVLVSTHPKPTVRILEIKSCQKLPEVLYPSYEMQVYGQVGLLERKWTSPDFSYTDGKGVWQFGGLTFPEAAKKLWGIDLPEDVTTVDIEAWVLCLSMTEAKVFGPYKPAQDILDMGLDAGVELWRITNQLRAGIVDSAAIPTSTGFHPLCEFCNWKTDCPKFKGELHPELEHELDELSRWKREKADLELKIKERESAMKRWYELANLHGNWVQAGHHRFKSSELPGRKKLDKYGLEDELTDIFRREGIEGIDVSDLIDRHEEVGTPSTRLYFSDTH